MLIRVAVLACCLALLGGCTSGSAGPEDRRTREQRVADHFRITATDVEVKDGLASPPVLSYLMVDEDRTDDGRVRSLWASGGQPRLRCYYLYTERDGRFVQGAGGCGGGEDRTVTLGGAVDDLAADLFGDVGSWPASSVSIAANGLEATVPVKHGYFLVPVRVTTSGARIFAISLLDAEGKVIGREPGVKLPGR